MNEPTPGPWKTGREDMQSYTGDGEIAFTNIYHETLTDGEHLGRPLPLTIGRAEGDNNKANAKLIAATPELLAACQLFTKAAHDARDVLNGAGLPCPSSIAFAAEQARAALAKAGL